MGYFGKSSIGYILTVIITDISNVELQVIKMIDSIVNGYIDLIAIILFLLLVCSAAGVSCIVGVTLLALAMNGISRKSHSNVPAKQKSQEELTDTAIEYIHGLPVINIKILILKLLIALCHLILCIYDFRRSRKYQ